MGKTLKTVGAIVGGAVLIATGVGALAGLNVAAMGISTLTGSLTVGQLGTLASGLAAIGGALDKPKSSGAGNPSDWTSNPDQPTPILFGRMGVAGKIVHRDEFGPDDDMYQGIVGILSGGGPIKSVLGFKGDDQDVTFDANGKAITSQWKDEMWMRYRMGAQPDLALVSPPGLKNGATLPDWGNSHKLSGKACYLQVLAENSKGSAYQWREPDPMHLVEGIAGWDPRFDSTYPGGLGDCRFGVRATYRYITDPIIAGLNWSLGIVENGKVIAGIGASPTGVDIDSFVQAANVSTANDWIIAGWPDTSEDVSQVLGQMLQAGGASRARNAGRISCVTRGAVLPSVVTITADDLAGPLELDTGASLFNRLNTITPKFMSEAHKWQHVAGSPVTFPALVTEDGGEHADQIDYRFVPQAKQAGELAALDILDAREPFSGTIPLKPHLRRLKPGSRFTISAPGLLLDGVKCMELGRSYTAQTGEVRISFRSETEGKIPLALGKTTTLPAFPELSPPDRLLVTKPAAGDWAIVPRAANADGIQLPIWDLVGLVDNSTATGLIVEIGQEPEEGVVPDPLPPGAAFADYVAWTEVYSGSPLATTIPIQGMQPGEDYYVAVRYQRGQNYSIRTLYGPETAPGKKPPAPTGLDVQAFLLAPDAVGVQQSVVRATWNAVSLVAAPDLAGYDTEYTEAGQPAITRQVVGTSDKWQQAVPGISYEVRVRSRSKSGAVSAWTSPFLVVGAGDPGAPLPTLLLDAIAAAVGDYEPPDLAEFRADIEGQIDAVEAQAVAAQGAITAEVTARTAAITAETSARNTAIAAEAAARIAAISAEASARGTAISGVQASVTTVSTNLATLTTSTTTQFAAVNGSISTVDSRVTTVATNLAAETTSRTSDVSSLNGSISFVLGYANTIATDLASETTTRTSQGASLGASIATVDGRVTTVANNLSAETTARATQGSTLGASIATVDGRVTTVANALTAETSTRTSQYSTLNGAIADVNTLATTTASALAAETSTRQTQYSELGGSIASVSTQITTVANDLVAETTVRTAAVSSLAGSVSFLLTYSDTIASDLSAETTARVSQGSSLGASIATVDSRVTTVATNLSAETATRTSQISGINGTLATVQTSVTTVANNLAAETSTRTTQTAALGTSIAAVDSRVTTVVNSVSAEVTTRTQEVASLNGSISFVLGYANGIATDLSAQTTRIDTLTASVGANSASITTVSAVAANASGVANAIRGVVLNVNNYISGYRSENNGTVSSFNILADSFGIRSPGGGARTEYIAGVWYVWDGAGTLTMYGKAFGADSLVWWTGPESASPSKANAYVYVSTTAPRFGGSDTPTSGLKVSASSVGIGRNVGSPGNYTTTAAVNLTVTGGSGSYSYEWFTISSQSDQGNASNGQATGSNGSGSAWNATVAAGETVSGSFGCLVRDTVTGVTFTSIHTGRISQNS